MCTRQYGSNFNFTRGTACKMHISRRASLNRTITMNMNYAHAYINYILCIQCKCPSAPYSHGVGCEFEYSNEMAITISISSARARSRVWQTTRTPTVHILFISIEMYAPPLMPKGHVTVQRITSLLAQYLSLSNAFCTTTFHANQFQSCELNSARSAVCRQPLPNTPPLMRYICDCTRKTHSERSNWIAIWRVRTGGAVFGVSAHGRIFSFAAWFDYLCVIDVCRCEHRCCLIRLYIWYWCRGVNYTVTV